MLEILHIIFFLSWSKFYFTGLEIKILFHQIIYYQQIVK